MKHKIYFLVLAVFIAAVTLIPAFDTEARERGDRQYPEGREPTTEPTPTPDPIPEPEPSPLPSHDNIVISQETLERWEQYILDGNYDKVIEEYEALLRGEEIPIPDDSEPPAGGDEPQPEDCEPPTNDEEDRRSERHPRTITRTRGDTSTTEETPPVCEEQTEEPEASGDEPPAEEDNDDGGDPTYVELVALEIHRLTNLVREEVGLEPLESDPTLESIAQAHSEYMADNNFFSHTRLDGCGVKCRLDEGGYDASSWGENIAWRSSTVLPSAEELALIFFSTWMNSSGHQANILSENFTDEGVGVAQIDNRVFVTVDFARP